MTQRTNPASPLSAQQQAVPEEVSSSLPAGRGINSIKNSLRDKLSPQQYGSLKRKARNMLAWVYRNDLNRLALIYGSDKWGKHWYTQHYQRYFHPLRHKPLTIFEIGVGGYESREVGGESHRMWKRYFPKSRIIGIDICDKTHMSEPRIDIRQCDQTDAESLLRLSQQYGGFDIIIDDGSHLNHHVIQTFEILFPHLHTGGLYVIEDMQTAYWPTWGGGMNHPANSMAYFTKLIDGLNYSEYPIPGYEPTYYDKNIVEMAFFHNMAFIRKGNNDEKAGYPDLIRREIEATKTPS